MLSCVKTLSSTSGFFQSVVLTCVSVFEPGTKVFKRVSS